MLHDDLVDQSDIAEIHCTGLGINNTAVLSGNAMLILAFVGCPAITRKVMDLVVLHSKSVKTTGYGI